MSRIISRPHNTRKTNYNQLQGSGLYPRNPVCSIPKCTPKPLPTPTSPRPRSKPAPTLQPQVAIKAPKNKWKLGKQTYPNFNSMWINMPRKYTVLKNG